FHGGGRAFTAAGLADFTVVDSTVVDFTAVSPTCTMVSAVATGVTGTVAGITEATAGGGVTGWDGVTIRMITGMVILITDTIITASPPPAKPGTIAPIRRAITPIKPNATRAGGRPRPAARRVTSPGCLPRQPGDESGRPTNRDQK